jgi:hypothetical protein
VQYRHRTAEASKFRHRRVIGELDVRASIAVRAGRSGAARVRRACHGRATRSVPSFSPVTARLDPRAAVSGRSYLRAVKRTHRTQDCLRIELPIRKIGLS